MSSAIAVQRVKQSIEDLTRRFDALEGRISAIEKRIGTLTESDADLRARVAAHSNNLMSDSALDIRVEEIVSEMITSLAANTPAYEPPSSVAKTTSGDDATLPTVAE